MEIKKIGVVGAGTMGSGITQTFAINGFDVVLGDHHYAGLERGLGRIAKSLAHKVERGLITFDEQKAALGRIATTTHQDEMADCDLVIEAVVEDLHIKIMIFKELDRICKPETILATNTSSISPTRLAAETGRPSHVIGMHFMNPAPVLPLVEIVRAMQTEDEVYAAVETLTHKIGKTPVEAHDSPGFVSNRILMPMINEAIFCLQENVATVDGIDTLFTKGMNHPMGPLTLADMIGLDNCLVVLNELYDGFKDPKFRPCPLLQKMVDAGYLGQKSGRGFHHYDE